jgi:hypothetical protein
MDGNEFDHVLQFEAQPQQMIPIIDEPCIEVEPVSIQMVNGETPFLKF